LFLSAEQRSAAAAEAAARRLAEVQRSHETEVAALREVARAKEKVRIAVIAASLLHETDRSSK